MEIDEKYQLSVEAGEKAYNDSEGNLEYALVEALKHFWQAAWQRTQTPREEAKSTGESE